MVTPDNADLTGLIRVGHWSPTDFTFRGEGEGAYIAQLSWPRQRAVVELWCFEHEELPVPENPPNHSEVYVEPGTLTSSEAMGQVLAECAVLAAEAGAKQIGLPCPSDLRLEEETLDIIERKFHWAWLRKKL